MIVKMKIVTCYLEINEKIVKGKANVSYAFL
jgi:hypothetical protein